MVCSAAHASNCAAYPKSVEDEQLLVNTTLEYRRLTNELIESGRYDTTDDFSVVIQPYMRDFNPPRLANGKVDLSYFAPDCFHFAAKSHGKF